MIPPGFERDSSRTWSSRSCVEQFGIYRENPIMKYNYYKNNSRFIRSGVVAAMLGIVILLVFLTINNITKTNVATTTREKDAYLRLLKTRSSSASTSQPENTTNTNVDVENTLEDTNENTASQIPEPNGTDTEDETHTEYHNGISDSPIENAEEDTYNYESDTYNYGENRKADEVEETTTTGSVISEALHYPRQPPRRRVYQVSRQGSDRRYYENHRGSHESEDIHIHIPAARGRLKPGDISIMGGNNRHRGRIHNYDFVGDVYKNVANNRNRGDYQMQASLHEDSYDLFGKPSPRYKYDIDSNYYNTIPSDLGGYHYGVPRPYQEASEVYSTIYKRPHEDNFPPPLMENFKFVNKTRRKHKRPSKHSSILKPIIVPDGPESPSSFSEEDERINYLVNDGYKTILQNHKPYKDDHVGSKYESHRDQVKDYTSESPYTHNKPGVVYASEKPSNQHVYFHRNKDQSGEGYPKYWNPYLSDLNQESSGELRIVNRKPIKQPTRIVHKKPVSDTKYATSNRFPQLTNYQYPKDAKNIGDIIRYLTRFDIKQSENKVPLFADPGPGIMKLKGVYLSHENDDDSESSAESVPPNTKVSSTHLNGHSYNPDPFSEYKPENMAEINYMLQEEMRFPTKANQMLFKNTMRHLEEKRKGDMDNQNQFYFPRPPVKYFNEISTQNSEDNHDNSYTTAIFHPYGAQSFSTINTKRKSKKKSKPMSVMFDIFPLDEDRIQHQASDLQVDQVPSTRPTKRPTKTLHLNLQPQNKDGGPNKQHMVVHLNLYPKKKRNPNDRSDTEYPTSVQLNFNSDTHDISTRRYYNEDYEGDANRDDDNEYYDDDGGGDDGNNVPALAGVGRRGKEIQEATEMNDNIEEKENKEDELQHNIVNIKLDFAEDGTSIGHGSQLEGNCSNDENTQVSQVNIDTKNNTGTVESSDKEDDNVKYADVKMSKEDEGNKEKGESGAWVKDYAKTALDRIDTLLGNTNLSKQDGNERSGNESSANPEGEYGRKRILLLLESEVQKKEKKDD